MTAATPFPSVLGAEFAALDPCLRWVHSGESRGGNFNRSDLARNCSGSPNFERP
jgi:hypothetical protein